MNISRLNTTAQIEDEEARNTKPSQRDCLGCFNLGKKKKKTMSINNEYFMLSSTLKSRLIRINFTSLRAYLSLNRQHNNPDHTKCSTHSRIG
jgi:hypothetical protein